MSDKMSQSFRTHFKEHLPQESHFAEHLKTHTHSIDNIAVNMDILHYFQKY